MHTRPTLPRRLFSFSVMLLSLALPFFPADNTFLKHCCKCLLFDCFSLDNLWSTIASLSFDVENHMNDNFFPPLCRELLEQYFVLSMQKMNGTLFFFYSVLHSEIVSLLRCRESPELHSFSVVLSRHLEHCSFSFLLCTESIDHYSFFSLLFSVDHLQIFFFLLCKN